MDFKLLLHRAKEGSREAREQRGELCGSVLVREDSVTGIFDEDLYQEFCVTLLHCIEKFTL